jgi:hypothetical protein
VASFPPSHSRVLSTAISNLEVFLVDHELLRNTPLCHPGSHLLLHGCLGQSTLRRLSHLLHVIQSGLLCDCESRSPRFLSCHSDFWYRYRCPSSGVYVLHSLDEITRRSRLIPAFFLPFRLLPLLRLQLVRFRANYTPIGVALDEEAFVGPSVTSLWAMMRRVKELEGIAGLYKGRFLSSSLNCLGVQDIPPKYRKRTVQRQTQKIPPLTALTSTPFVFCSLSRRHPVHHHQYHHFLPPHLCPRS